MKQLIVELGKRSYPITIGTGTIRDSSLFASAIKHKNVMVVTNETIAPLYLDILKTTLKEYNVSTCILPDGEEFKTLDSFNLIITAMLENSMGRDSTIVALGGGVVGDISGYAAASYQRGVDFVQVPTTLLSQVDSSVGGKTGVNHPLGKNMIGAFYQPKAVVIDLDCLKTLPSREISAGMAEVIKYGIIWDYEFFKFLENNIDSIMKPFDGSIHGFDNIGLLLEHMISTCCSIKADVVHQDECEGGIRALLNLGHTFGHAIESFMGYGNWLHGEAVAAGMVIASDVSVAMGLIDNSYNDRIKALIKAANLPIESPKNMTANDFMQKMVHDKKVKNGKIRYVLPSAQGKSAVFSDVDPELVSKVIGE